MLKVKEDRLEELVKLGFKPDKRKNVLYSITDELFGDVVVVWEDKRVSFSDFSDGIRFKMMTENIIEQC